MSNFRAQISRSRSISGYGNVGSNEKSICLSNAMSSYYPAYSERKSSTRSSRDCEKAWHVLAILLSIGRPAFPEELALKCELFGATPDFVRFLCSIPGSPIRLLDNCLVTVSVAVVSAIAEFASKSMTGGLVSSSGNRFQESERVWNFDLKTYIRKRKGRAPDCALLSGAKRMLISSSDQGETDLFVLSLPNRIEDISTEDVGHGNEDGVSNKIVVHKESSGFLQTSGIHCDLIERETDLNGLRSEHVDRFTAHKHGHKVLCNESLMGDVMVKNKGGQWVTFFSDKDKQHGASAVNVDLYYSHSCGKLIDHSVENAEHLAEVSRKKGVVDYDAKEDTKNCVPPNKFAGTSGAMTNCFESRNPVNDITLYGGQRACKVEPDGKILLTGQSSIQEQPEKSFRKPKDMCKNFPPQRRVLTESLEYNKAINIRQTADEKFLPVEHNSKNIENNEIYGKENRVDSTTMHLKNQLERKALPHFDNFIIEDEEGSGGYGTVYRARRKSDGKTCAIKCPHAKAHKHHVNNELKMLERFGGRNFIIKYGGSLKYRDTDCFILEHVDHDRPEVLKKEIDLFQLQWYGYCMFRALAHLHKQGVVHRDIKPGNFLFSRKLNKGYLIDFNLAMDLQQKLAVGSKSKSNFYTSFGHVPLPSSKTGPLTKDKKIVRDDRLAVNLDLKAMVDTKSRNEHKKCSKKRARVVSLKHPDMSGCSKLKSQGADGSGITSTKDATSTRTPSAERIREPLPSLGRKELITLVQGVMQSPNNDAVETPVSQRKRIAAPPGEVESRIFYMSPMPLYSNGVAVTGAGLLKGKGDGRQKREGPCVGTKGFRAPEVLFRSVHQGPKVDVWSAGVALLYLMIGRTPFTGEPEQNIKEIAKLKGSEDLWEVAKLHDRESSFPVELLDVRSLPSMELESWCKANTRRPNFFRLIPRSLFDLVDKCLTVNPRIRISAEEALRHEFFALCRESLRKQRMLGREISTQTNHAAHEQISHYSSETESYLNTSIQQM